MRQRAIAIGVIAGTIVIAILAAIGAVTSRSITIEKKTTNRGVPSSQQSPAPAISYEVQQDRFLVKWTNLPDGTSVVRVFRAKRSSRTDWEFWKEVAIPNGVTSGSAEIVVSGEDLTQYLYAFQAVAEQHSAAGGGGGGSVLWQSEELAAAQESSSQGGGNGTTSPPPSSSSNSSNQQGGTGASSSPPPSSTPDNHNTESNSSTGQNQNSNNAPGANQPPPQEGTFYTPELKVSSTELPDPTDHFWARHINQQIEIGWQDIPSATSLVIVRRSPQAQGGFQELLRQENPETAGSYALRLVDDTLHKPRYYLLQAYSASDELLQEYGPVFLDALP